jgi:hypothetical protein
MTLSQILTGIRNVPVKRVENKWANATWRKGYASQQMAQKEHTLAERYEVMENSQAYNLSNISNPYRPINQNVLKMRLVHENSTYAILSKQKANDKQARRFNYYDPINEAPAPRKTPYSGTDFYLTMV